VTKIIAVLITVHLLCGGCLKEIKTHEYRVGLTPSDVKSYVSRGHKVTIQLGAGEAAGFTDREYKEAGAAKSPIAKRSSMPAR